VIAVFSNAAALLFSLMVKLSMEMDLALLMFGLAVEEAFS
jgi:hypothetical protein